MPKFVERTLDVTHRRVPFREISAGLPYNGGDIDSKERWFHMYSEEYEKAKKEFNNCLRMCIIGLGVPIYNAFHEWLPIMKREKERALKAQKEAKE